MPPASIPDWLALVGDTADGFPGLPGFGAKTAAAVLDRYGHIEAIPDDAKAWDVTGVRGADRLAATLATGRAVADQFKVLATLRTDADVGTVDDWEWQGPTDDLAPGANASDAPRLLGAGTEARANGEEIGDIDARGDDRPRTPRHRAGHAEPARTARTR